MKMDINPLNVRRNSIILTSHPHFSPYRRHRSEDVGSEHFGGRADPGEKE